VVFAERSGDIRGGELVSHPSIPPCVVIAKSPEMVAPAVAAVESALLFVRALLRAAAHLPLAPLHFRKLHPSSFLRESLVRTRQDRSQNRPSRSAVDQAVQPVFVHGLRTQFSFVDGSTGQTVHVEAESPNPATDDPGRCLCRIVVGAAGTIPREVVQQKQRFFGVFEKAGGWSH